MARVSVRFQNILSGKSWIKSYKSKSAGTRAVKGILSKGRNYVFNNYEHFSFRPQDIRFEKSKGMKYGRVLKNYNLGLH